ncbi:YhgE/Pip domain-containing protein [Subtercola sp. PAMC28395]|uniref:YhgE/Pip domain-containing protein n=1 Tax=Subtercola sp. PAMC28395 TaxID=2846775 RepID=UPI001C0C5F10|nr:YhgE/Pip domain-containing protein [Subtercola sp. PAMC28395]QWT24778.1 YhgE/Pip domain-containing protein [Subtercola sp. PAMC28395]
MKILTLAKTEFRRLTASGLARLALVALMLVPVIYAGLYLWANSDPYGNIKNIPVALVIEDTGATLNDKPVNYGQQVHDQLIRDGGVDWIDASAEQAASGVKDGTYDFVLTLGPDFSTMLVSAGTATPQQAVVQLTTNDTNSFLASSIAATVAEKVRLSISEQVGQAAALQFLDGFATIHDNLGTAVDGSAKLVDGTAQAQAGASTLASGAAQVNSGAADLASGAATAASGASTLSDGAAQTNAGAQKLASGLGTLNSQAASLPAQTAALNSGAQQVAAGNAHLASLAATASTASQGAADQVPVVRAQIVSQLQNSTLTPDQQAAILAQLDTLGSAVTSGNTKVQTATGQVAQLSGAASQVAAGTQKLADAAPALTAGISSAASGAAQVASGTQQVADGASSLADGTQKLADGAATLKDGTQQLADGSATLATGTASLNTGATQLHDGLVSGLAQIPNYSAAQRQQAAATIATPARVDTDTVTKATTYGAGMAPFFISLAAWIGIYALFLIIKPLSKRALTAIKAPLRVTLAGWLAPAALGALQMAAVFFVVTVLLGFTVVNPALMLLFMVLASVTFVAIILALNVWLGSVGQFIGLVLMVLQLVTAGGTFPWQTLPGPLAALHHALPMSYAVDGIRQLMYGGDLMLALNDAGVLLAWMLGALAFTYYLAGKATRSRTLRDLRPSLIG